MSQSLLFRTSELSAAKPYRIDYQPDAATVAELVRDMQLSGLRKLHMTGVLAPKGGNDWQFDGHLGATVIQPCVVTLDPVTTRIEEDLHRVYLKEWQEPEENEVEMPADDSFEALGREIDLGNLLREALALAIPAYPRTEGAELGESVFTKEGARPMTDDDAKPFAGLAALKNKLTKPN